MEEKSTMGKVWLAIIIIITIVYGCFVTMNAFVTKKQITMSMVDVVYLMIVSGWSVGEGSISGFKITVVVYILLIIWFAVLCHVLERNENLNQ